LLQLRGIIVPSKSREGENMTGYYNTFVVRILIEDQNKLKGYIQHLSTQEETHFINLEDMKKFILNHLMPQNDDVSKPEENNINTKPAIKI
jgi:hypothetical protein